MINKKMLYNLKGLTLIELIIVITIIGLVGGLIGKICVDSFINIKEKVLITSLREDAKFAIQKIEDDIRKSSDVHIYTDESLTTEITEAGTDGKVICCKNAFSEEKHTWFIYDDDNDKLLRVVNDNEEELPSLNSANDAICSNVESFIINIKLKSDNVILYYLELNLKKGKVNVLLDTQIKKYNQ